MSGPLRRLLFILLGITTALSWGCGQKPPADKPQTIPFSVSVTKAGQPLEGANVFFVPDSHPNNLICTGLTDPNGIARMNTQYFGFPLKGAPVGSNKVYIVKEADDMHTKSKEERAAMGYAEGKKYEAERQKRRESQPIIIPKSLTSVTTSPLTVNVATGTEQLTIEVDDYKE